MWPKEMQMLSVPQPEGTSRMPGNPSLIKKANVNLLTFRGAAQSCLGDSQMCNLAFILPPSLFFAYQQMCLRFQEQVLGPDTYPGEENL